MRDPKLKIKMVNMKTGINFQNGMGIIETMVALGIFSILMFAIARFQTNIFKTHKAAKNYGEYLDLRDYIAHKLSCSNTLSTASNCSYPIKGIDIDGNEIAQQLGDFEVEFTCSDDEPNRVFVKAKRTGSSKPRKDIFEGIPVVCTPSPCTDPSITYSNKNAFVSETESVSAGSYPNLRDVISFTMGNMTFRAINEGADYQEAFRTSNQEIDYRTPLDPLGAGTSICENGLEDMNISLSGGDYNSIGFYLFEPTDAFRAGTGTVYDTTFKIRFYKDATWVATREYNGANNAISFHGFWLTTPFNRMEIRDKQDGNDNEYYGQFFIGQKRVCP